MNGTRRLVRRLFPRPLRNWVRAPRKTLRWVSDAVLHAVGADRTLDLRPDWRLRCHPTAFRAIRSTQLDDPAQSAELAEFIDCCEPGMVLFDLGAHFGVFSLAALHYGGGKARAFAVEPSPAAARIMRIQAGLNTMGGRLNLIQAAAAEAPGTQEMLAAGVIADGFFVAATGDRPERELTQVSAVSIDSLAESAGVRPTHLKIDVEGFEAAALRGGRATLTADDRPVVFLELHVQMVRDRGDDPAEALDLLARYGYEEFTLNGAPATREQLLEAPITRLVARTARR